MSTPAAEEPNNKKKSAADLQKEQEEARQALEQLNLFQSSAPKDAAQGLGRGVSNILGGAVGGAGLLVLAPTAGLAVGMKNGGLLGGIVGVTGGAIVGVVGGASMILGGAVSGVSQIVRGVVATPTAHMAKKAGKWWNESTHKWVLTNLEVDMKTCPTSDDDILKKIEDEVDAAGKPTGKEYTGEIKDTYYYDVLEVDPQADASAIKRKYYIMARKYHPDKVGPDDKEAAEKFKAAAEAYQVLSDPELRTKYNQDGREALSGDKTTTVDDANNRPFDPAILLAFLFGSDRFDDYIGRLATSTSAMLGDSPKISVADAQELQRRRCLRLALKLVVKIEPWMQDATELCSTTWKAEAESLATASYGWELVQSIGMAYELAAVQFLGSRESGLGMPSIAKWASSKQAKAKTSSEERKQKMETMMASMDAMKIQLKYKELITKAATDEEKQKLEREMAEEIQGIMLRVIWATTAIDITSTIHETCQMVFFDVSVDKSVREKRARAVQNLGQIFQATPEPVVVTGAKKDARKLFEEATLAATVETMKRKDEATFSAGGNH